MSPAIIPPRQSAPSLPPAMEALYQRLARMESKIAQLERSQRASQLASSTIDAGTLVFNDASGQPALQVGLQQDGTHAVVAVSQRNPEQPSDPVVSGAVGGLYAIWDGFMATETPPLSDFAAIQVHCSLTAGFTPSADTLQGTMITGGIFGIGGLTPDTVYYVAFVTVTAAGVTGPSSNQITGVTLSILDGIGPGGITTGLIGIGAVTGANIAAQTITAANIVAGSITSNEIAASTIAAANLAAGIIKAGIVDGTTITGAQFVATGTTGEFLGYNGTPAFGNLIVSVSPVAGADQYGNAYLAGVITYTMSGGIAIAQGWQSGAPIFATATGGGGPYTVASGTFRQITGGLLNGFFAATDANGTSTPPVVTQLDAHTIVMAGRVGCPASGTVTGVTFATLGSPFLLPATIISEFPTSNAAGGQSGSILLRPNGNLQLSGGFNAGATVITAGAFRF